MRITNLVDSTKLADHELVIYSGLEDELVICLQRHGIVTIRITIAPHAPPQVMLVDPPTWRRR